MRVAHNEATMRTQLPNARAEAEAAFKDDRVYVEKLIDQPRHIEVQVLGDADGSVIHLHERDCSIQQRNQKVIEIAPAPALEEELRERILSDATKLAHESEYVNAGTVEFLVSPETGEHY
ncbi:MAG: pyruvate carboxylase, partial [Nitrospirae bacterium]|nr:pyruvate carboxylase [Nitrospirota bacterium]